MVHAWDDPEQDRDIICRFDHLHPEAKSAWQRAVAYGYSIIEPVLRDEEARKNASGEAYAQLLEEAKHQVPSLLCARDATGAYEIADFKSHVAVVFAKWARRSARSVAATIGDPRDPDTTAKLRDWMALDPGRRTLLKYLRPQLERPLHVLAQFSETAEDVVRERLVSLIEKLRDNPTPRRPIAWAEHSDAQLVLNVHMYLSGLTYEDWERLLPDVDLRCHERTDLQGTVVLFPLVPRKRRRIGGFWKNVSESGIGVRIDGLEPDELERGLEVGVELWPAADRRRLRGLVAWVEHATDHVRAGIELDYRDWLSPGD